MAFFNSVTVIGRLTKDAELRFTPKGTALLQLSLAVNEKRGDKEQVHFFDVKAWAGTAEGASSLKKGEEAIVCGRLQFESWDDKQSGQKRSRTTILAEAIGRTLYRRSEAAPGSSGRISQSAPAEPAAPKQDDDVPF